MAKLLPTMLIHKTGFNNSFFSTTEMRLGYLLAPIQSVKTRKDSDVVDYLLSPIVDTIATPFFIYDALVSLVNTIASALRGIYFSTFDLGKSDFKETKECFKQFLGSVVALFNPIISTLALLTRPVASIVHAVSNDSVDSSTTRFNRV